MSTIGEVATWAYEMVNRPDLKSFAVDYARSVYLLVCCKVPFPELQVMSTERPTVVGQQSYSISDLNLAGIMSLRMTYTSTNRRRLKRSDTRVYDALGNVVNGKPATYARFGTNLEFMPVPDSASYTYRLRYWEKPTFPVSPDALSELVLITPLEWDELLKWETLYRMYTHTEQHDKAMLLVAPVQLPRQPSPQKTRQFEMGIIPRLWNDLLQTTNQRENVDEDFSVNPISRRITSG